MVKKKVEALMADTDKNEREYSLDNMLLGMLPEEFKDRFANMGDLSDEIEAQIDYLIGTGLERKRTGNALLQMILKRFVEGELDDVGVADDAVRFVGLGCLTTGTLSSLAVEEITKFAIEAMSGMRDAENAQEIATQGMMVQAIADSNSATLSSQISQVTAILMICAYAIGRAESMKEEK